MTTIQTITAIILTPTLIVGGMVFLLRKLFEQLLSRDLEKHKARLQIEFEQSKLRLENQLQTKLFQFQTKFSLYHQKQASVISELYEKLSEAQMYLSRSVHPIQLGGRSPKEKFDEADEKRVDLARFYNRNRIYLDEDVCLKMDSILTAMHTSAVKFSVSQSEPKSGSDIEMWVEAWKVMENEIPPIKEALERKFRQILSSVAGNEDDQIVST